MCVAGTWDFPHRARVWSLARLCSVGEFRGPTRGLLSQPLLTTCWSSTAVASDACLVQCAWEDLFILFAGAVCISFVHGFFKLQWVYEC